MDCLNMTAIPWLSWFRDKQPLLLLGCCCIYLREMNHILYKMVMVMHLQQYFSYIVAVSFIVGWNQSTWTKSHRPVASYWQTLLHNVISSTLRQSWSQTWNVCGDSHWLHRHRHYLYIKCLDTYVGVVQ